VEPKKKKQFLYMFKKIVSLISLCDPSIFFFHLMKVLITNLFNESATDAACVTPRRTRNDLHVLVLLYNSIK